MAESWFALRHEDQAEALEVAAGLSGRPPHLLEKDLWLVWALAAIYSSSLAETLTFKGGTSLSKVYKVIDRFSEDIDLTYDIRALVPDLLRDGEPIPKSASHEKKITRAIRTRLPEWINEVVLPIINNALLADGLEAGLTVAGEHRDKLLIEYPPVKAGTGYVAPTIQLEFGARATGEPHQFHEITCDMAPWIDGLIFPTAKPLVMTAERTFWEKVTAAHVFCCQNRMRGHRYSRHWFDLVALARAGYFSKAAADRRLAQQVAEHKSVFFREKDLLGCKIDYFEAVNGSLRLVPEGAARKALEEDFTAMCEDGLLMGDPPDFAEILEVCAFIEEALNRLARASR